MRLSSSLGQVFLKKKSYIKKIIDSLDVKGEKVVEIGPGSGRMTIHLLPLVDHLYAVEVDSRLVEILSHKFIDANNIEIIHKDILNFNFSSLKQKAVVFGNIPYQISKKIINHLISNRGFIKRAYLTCQKEFVDKVVAESGKEYNFLSCYTQYYAKVNKSFDIPASAFSPIPKVDSAFMSLDFYDKPLI